MRVEKMTMIKHYKTQTFIGIYHTPGTGLSALYPLFNIAHKTDVTISLNL